MCCRDHCSSIQLQLNTICGTKYDTEEYNTHAGGVKEKQRKTGKTCHTHMIPAKLVDRNQMHNVT